MRLRGKYYRDVKQRTNIQKANRTSSTTTKTVFGDFRKSLLFHWKQETVPWTVLKWELGLGPNVCKTDELPLTTPWSIPTMTAVIWIQRAKRNTSTICHQLNWWGYLSKGLLARKNEGHESGCSLPFETNYFLHPGQHLSLTICHLLSKVLSEVPVPGGQSLVHSDQAHFKRSMKSALCCCVAQSFIARLTGNGCAQFTSPMFRRSKPY